MEQYDVKCPFCGTENKDLFLEETDGWMECEHCLKLTLVLDFSKETTKANTYIRKGDKPAKETA